MRGVRGRLAAFAAAGGVHLGALLTRRRGVERATKPVLMPLLAEYVLVRGGPRLLALALLLGAVGDVLLQCEGEAAFLAGMGAFAAGHGCYLALFARQPKKNACRLAVPYGAVWALSVAALWPGLPSQLRLPVALYSLLLTAMAAGAAGAGPRAAAGGALFLLSDGLIAGGLAGWPQARVPQFWVMVTYLAAQLLLVEGLLARPEGNGAGRVPGPVPGEAGQSWTAARASTMP
ncbi:lysoplasmalogenase [Streptomyces orinoci]|uniref:Lysoplasmalogenase n=1 Tax=Streptomyces orinoci TaxID=67339 RepID=A0ABV3JWX5_STRON|nr:lysoplasmalogenase [Streptomyces orinoci]